MNSLVTYFSMTGNTEKMANEVYNTLESDKEILEISKVENFDKYDVIFLGFPIMDFGMPKNIEKLISERIHNQKIVLFISHAMPPSSPKLKELIAISVSKISENNLISYFNCQGEMSIELAELLAKHDDPMIRQFGERRELSIGHPTLKDLSDLKEFTRDSITKTNN